MYVYIYATSYVVGSDTKSSFQRRTGGFNFEFSVSKTGCPGKTKELSLSTKMEVEEMDSRLSQES